MNDYNFPEVSKEIINSIQSARQSGLLDKSYLKCHASLSKEISINSNIDHNLIVREQLRQMLSQQIIGITEEHIKVENYGDSDVYSLELCVFPLEDLKHIIEYSVKQMSMEEILKIKNK